jgi:hypothetical protein
MSIEAELPQESIAAPLEDCLDTFWEAGEDLDSFVTNPALPEVDNAILKRLGKPLFASGKYDIVSPLAKAYSVASSAALQKALGSLQAAQKPVGSNRTPSKEIKGAGFCL